MRLSLRFDVDTWCCAHRGIPFLIQAAERFDARFWFMVNMGRAASRRTAVLNLLKPAAAQAAAETQRIDKLSAIQRSGWRGYARTALLNPQVGASAAPVLRAAARAGHVLGLHGGRNHGQWQWGAHRWSAQRLREEVRWGLDAFTAAGLERPTCFSSPGWNSPEPLPRILEELGFSELHDSHRPGEPADRTRRRGPMIDINTAFAGEPGGVGYFESCMVRGITAEQAAANIAQVLSASPQRHAVAYDHPVFCQGVGQPLFLAVLRSLRERGVELGAGISGEGG